MSRETAVLAALDGAAADRRRAKADEADAMDRIRELVNAADALGVGRTVIQRRAGLAVATMYAMFTLPNRRVKRTSLHDTEEAS